MSRAAIEIIFILLLIGFNGVLAMAELAIVSARRTRLQLRADEGDRRAIIALSLGDNQSEFLSTVQIGITLVGILTGAVGGATLGDELAPLIESIPWLAPYSSTIAIVLVVIVITYLSLVIGELAPKQLALSNSEAIAITMAPAMKILAKITRPAVWLLSGSTKALLSLFGVKMSSDLTITDDDIRQLIGQGTEVGVFEPIEEEIVGQVFRLSDRTVSALLTPRTDIIWLELDDTPDQIREKLVTSRFAQFPVARGDLDSVVGIVLTKDLLAQVLAGQPLDLHSVLRQPLFIPESTPALEVVDRLKETGTHIALVIDEYGGLEGMVTLDDIFDALIGGLPDSDEVTSQEEVQRADGSWLMDGMYSIDQFKDKFDLAELPDEAEGYYQTLGGFMMRMLEKVPTPGDSFQFGGLQLEVMDMDGRRVDKVLVAKIESESVVVK